MKRMAKQSEHGRVYISHSQKDNDLVRDMARRLKEAGLVPIVDFMQPLVGAKWRNHVRKSLGMADAVIVLLTPESVKSDWVMMELGYADALNRPVVPITVGVQHRDVPGPLASYKSVSFDRLDDAIKDLATKLTVATVEE